MARAKALIRNDIIEECAKLVPTNWLDPLLTGPNKVIGNSGSPPDIEGLLLAVQKRIRDLKQPDHP